MKWSFQKVPISASHGDFKHLEKYYSIFLFPYFFNSLYRLKTFPQL